jgi:hypothetical protein
MGKRRFGVCVCCVSVGNRRYSESKKKRGQEEKGREEERVE